MCFLGEPATVQAAMAERAGSRLLARVVLVVHVGSSVAWVGAALAFTAVGVSAAMSDQQDLSAVDRALSDLTYWVVLPLAALSTVSGVAQSLLTRWGLLRHYWVTAKEGLTALFVVVLLLQLPRVRSLTAAGDHEAAREGLTLHAGVGSLLLLLPLLLSIFKPRGLTKRGHQLAHRTRASS